MYRFFYLFLGSIGIALTVAAWILPLVPATPFLLLSAFGFSRSSNQFYKLILSLPLVGDIIFNWEHHRVLARSTKLLFLSIIVPLVIVSAASLPMILALGIILIGLGLIIFIVTRHEETETSPHQNFFLKTQS